MTLSRVEFDYRSRSVPSEISDFLSGVSADVERHRVDVASVFRGFVPSDYESVYRCLDALYDSNLLCGDRFCEWGSGLSVVASLAALIGFESYGIEQDPALAEVADEICRSRGIPVTLIQGSFIPAGAQDLIDEAFANNNGDLALHTEPDLAYEYLGEEVDSFDLIFAFPWPNDVDLVVEIFDRFSAQGAVLMLYSDLDALTLLRKS